MTKASDNLFPKVLLDMQTSAPAAPSDADWKLYARPDGVYARSSNSEVGPFGSGATLTTGYVGYNTVGGTAFAAVSGTTYHKAFTPASNILLLSVEVYCALNAEGVNPTVSGGVLLDNGGSPREVVRYGTGAPLLDAVNGAGGLNARWLGIPIAPVLLTSGTQYWLQVGYTAGGNWLNFYRDGSGSDQTAAASSLYGDAGYFSLSDSGNTHSIRGLYLEL